MYDQKAKCLERPRHMLAMEFPHTSKSSKMKPQRRFPVQVKHPDSKFNIYNENVRKMRELLNKLSKDNYKHIEYQLLREFKYTAPLLK